MKAPVLHRPVADHARHPHPGGGGDRRRALAPELAAGIARVKKREGDSASGPASGTLRQAQALLNAPGITTTKGLRGRAIFAVLPGCALRRSEVAVLTDGRYSGVHAGGDGRRTAREYAAPCRYGDGTFRACDLRPCFGAPCGFSARRGVLGVRLVADPVGHPQAGPSGA